jgi:hypothetical protein
MMALRCGSLTRSSGVRSARSLSRLANSARSFVTWSGLRISSKVAFVRVAAVVSLVSWLGFAGSRMGGGGHRVGGYLPATITSSASASRANMPLGVLIESPYPSRIQ